MFKSGTSYKIFGSLPLPQKKETLILFVSFSQITSIVVPLISLLFLPSLTTSLQPLACHASLPISFFSILFIGSLMIRSIIIALPLYPSFVLLYPFVCHFLFLFPLTKNSIGTTLPNES